MKQLFHTLTALLLIAVINLYVLGVHTSAMSVPSSDAMSGMKHAKTSVSCIAICPSVTSNKLSDLEVTDKEEDDVPTTPFYTAYQQPFPGLERYHSAIARKVLKFDPPPGLPAYIVFAVFRT